MQICIRSLDRYLYGVIGPGRCGDRSSLDCWSVDGEFGLAGSRRDSPPSPIPGEVDCCIGEFCE